MVSYNIQKYEWFKEVLTMIGTFEQGVFGHLEYNDHDAVRLRLVRARDDRMTISAYLIGHDYDYNIFSSTWLYSECLTNINNYSITHSKVLSTTYYQYRDNEFIVKSQDWLFDSKFSTLKYPIQEDEYFQQLTLIDLPPEDEIERFMTVSREIISPYPEFVGFTFHGGIMMQEINETNYENMVQSVMDCMKELMQLETERKNGLVLKA